MKFWKIRCFWNKKIRKLKEPKKTGFCEEIVECDRCGNPVIQSEDWGTESILPERTYYRCQYCGFVRDWIMGYYGVEDTEHGYWLDNTIRGRIAERILAIPYRLKMKWKFAHYDYDDIPY